MLMVNLDPCSNSGSNGFGNGRRSLRLLNEYSCTVSATSTVAISVTIQKVLWILSTIKVPTNPTLIQIQSTLPEQPTKAC